MCLLTFLRGKKKYLQCKFYYIAPTMTTSDIAKQIEQIYECIFKGDNESDSLWSEKYKHFIDNGAINLESLCDLFDAQMSLFGFTKQQCLDSHEVQIRNLVYLDDVINS